MTATILEFPVERMRRPIIEQERNRFLDRENDAGLSRDPELTRARQFLVGRRVKNDLTGRVGKVTDCRRFDDCVKAKFFQQVKFGEAFQHEWIPAHLLSPDNPRGGSAA